MLSYGNLQNDAEIFRNKFKEHDPYPHLVIEDFLDPRVAEEVHAEFPAVNSLEWKAFRHVNSNFKFQKSNREDFPERIGQVMDELNSDQFVEWLRDVTGIPNLIADPHLAGGGMHQTSRGGYLNVHADFSVHPKDAHLMRRVNVLVYMNKDWKDEYNGLLELWDESMKNCVKKVSPDFNRAVIFYTPGAYHGHPDPLNTPEDLTRKSLALYYYTREDKPVTILSTEYKSRPSDSLVKRIRVFINKLLLRYVDRGRRVIRWILRK